MSQTPVREAIVRLCAEGFVTIISQREVTVKDVSYDELKEIFQVIGHLDSLAISPLVKSIDKEKLKELEEIVSKMKQCFKLKSIEEYMEMKPLPGLKPRVSALKNDWPPLRSGCHSSPGLKAWGFLAII